MVNCLISKNVFSLLTQFSWQSNSLQDLDSMCAQIGRVSFSDLKIIIFTDNRNYFPAHFVVFVKVLKFILPPLQFLHVLRLLRVLVHSNSYLNLTLNDKLLTFVLPLSLKILRCSKISLTLRKTPHFLLTHQHLPFNTTIFISPTSTYIFQMKLVILDLT